MATFALILSGGLGTRLWPITAQNMPKAFLSFDALGTTLLQRTISRAKKITASDRIYISAGIKHKEELYNQAKDISHDNIILEPLPKGTLACIGLSGLYIKRRDVSSVMVIMPGEQLIDNDELFQKLISLSAEYALENNCIVTLGIKPNFPATRFGYIHLGGRIFAQDDAEIHKSLGFIEKPDEKKASEFLHSGKYLWNSGIYILPTSLLFRLISEFAPDTYDRLSLIEEYIGSREEKETIERIYPDVRNISIDYAVMEKSEDILVIPADIGWNDMGTWTEVAETWGTDKDQNLCFGKHVGLDTSECVIYSPDKPVATIGINNIIIVDTPDGLLVCAKDRADDIKMLVQYIKK